MNPEKLVELLKGHKTYIQTHNFPDPDAIASAFGLQHFLRQHGVPTEICYDGKVEKLSTRKMFTVFGIEVLSADEIDDMTEEDYIVTVDSQKYNANLTDFIGDEVACIDHHPTYQECTYAYKDVRLVGSCATLIAEYFYKTNTPITPEVASALIYGIKMDTADFLRGVTDLDVDMFAWLYHHADQELIQEMYKNVMGIEDLKAYGAAIDNIHVYDGVGFAMIPFDCPDALIAIISDFVLSLDIVEVSVIYALRPDGIKFSVRSEIAAVDAGALVRNALREIGSGGGHKQMAGGFIPKEAAAALGEDMEYQIENRFLKQINEK